MPSLLWQTAIRWRHQQYILPSTLLAPAFQRVHNFSDCPALCCHTARHLQWGPYYDKKKNCFPFFSAPFSSLPAAPSWHKLDSVYQFVLLFSAVSYNEYSNWKEGSKEVGRDGQTVSSRGGEWWVGGRRIRGFRQPEYEKNCIVVTDAPCFYSLLYSAWMRLPGEHRGKKKCTQKKRRGRENGYW